MDDHVTHIGESSNPYRPSVSLTLDERLRHIALIPRLLMDDQFRERLAPRVSAPYTRDFFDKRFEKWRETYRDEVIEPVLNKTEAFLAFPSIRHILGQARSTLHFPHAMQHGRI